MNGQGPAGPSMAHSEWMQRLAVIGSVAAVALLLVGIVMLATAKNGGVIVFIVGLVGLILYGAMIPLSRRKNL